MSCPCGNTVVSASSVGSHTDTSWQAGQAAFADAWLWCSWCRPRTFTYPFCHLHSLSTVQVSGPLDIRRTGNTASLKSFSFSFDRTYSGWQTRHATTHCRRQHPLRRNGRQLCRRVDVNRHTDTRPPPIPWPTGPRPCGRACQCDRPYPAP